MTNYKKIQKIIHDEIEKWNYIKPNSITNNIMKQLDEANLISVQPDVIKSGCGCNKYYSIDEIKNGVCNTCKADM